jgi:hypothetical protein
MALSFYPIYPGRSKTGNGRFSYLLATRQTVDPSKPWTGIYITSDRDLGSGLAKSITIKDLFTQFADVPGTFNTLIFLYFAADAGANVTAIGGALDNIDWRPSAQKNQGTIVWVAAPSAIAQGAIDAAPRLPYSIPPSRNPLPFANNPGQQPLLSLAPGTTGSQSLFITGGATVPLSATTGNDGLLLGGGGLGIARGTSSADQQPVVATGQIEIPAGDANNGCLVFIGNFAGTGTFSFPGTLPLPTSGLGVGFQYGVTVDGDGSTPPTSGPVSYPLLDTPGSLQGWPTSAVLSILDNTETYFSLQPSGSNTVRSAFRTLLDGTILLTPQSDGSSQLVFNVGYGNSIYLTPQGAFTMAVDDGSGGDTEPSGLGNQLLCGLSGVEYISFVPGDLLWFYPDKPAGIIAELDTDLPKPANVALAFDATTPPKLTTAYAMVLPGPTSRADGSAYYSEPDQAPFFTKPKQSTDSNPLDLSYYALSIAQLPKAPGPPETYVPFPLLPYAAFVPATDPNQFGYDHQYVESFEYQLINPTRKSSIEKMAQGGTLQSHTAQGTDQGTDNVIAITPEGYEAVFSPNGLWQSLAVAKMGTKPTPPIDPTKPPKPTDQTYIDISFSPAAGPEAPQLPQPPHLPQPLQDAMLTNQQFLVITAATNLGTFDNTVTMNGWPFTLDLSKNTTVGDYYNVIIFKSANATVRQMAHHPELWTRYKDFNNTANDPNGRFLSNWLVDYLEQARTLYKGGVASLQNFVNLIDDVTWNGFLALRVSITTQSLPDPIEALLAGIDKSLFVAHHIGNQINHVAPPQTKGDDYHLNSAMFGLVHYVDPALGAEVNSLPPYIANPSTYDFKVLTLEAVFENAKLVNFSNKSLLTLNSLFGDSVQQTDAAGDSGANTLVLIGSYVKKNNPAYTFATAQGATTDFYVASNALARVEITSASMTVSEVPSIQTGVVGELQCSQPTPLTPPANETAYLARFNLAGNLQMAADPNFDLLSYQYLGFQNLGLDMYLVTNGGDRSFAFDSSALRIALTQTYAVDPNAKTPSDPKKAGSNLVRTGSMLAQFPLQLSGFITGCGGRLPDAMGYRALDTTAPKGITAASLDGSANWYALSFDLNLGSLGSLGPIGGLSAEMLLAWAPGGQGGGVTILPALKIAGPGGVSLSFDLEGVVKFGAADIVLNKIPALDNTPAQYVLMFESIAFTVLTFSFPPKGSTNIYLFGNAQPSSDDPIKPTLGWFGGYFEQQPPPQANSVEAAK